MGYAGSAHRGDGACAGGDNSDDPLPTGSQFRGTLESDAFLLLICGRDGAAVEAVGVWPGRAVARLEGSADRSAGGRVALDLWAVEMMCGDVGAMPLGCSGTAVGAARGAAADHELPCQLPPLWLGAAAGEGAPTLVGALGESTRPGGACLPCVGNFHDGPPAGEISTAAGGQAGHGSGDCRTRTRAAGHPEAGDEAQPSDVMPATYEAGAAGDESTVTRPEERSRCASPELDYDLPEPPPQRPPLPTTTATIGHEEEHAAAAAAAADGGNADEDEGEQQQPGQQEEEADDEQRRREEEEKRAGALFDDPIADADETQPPEDAPLLADEEAMAADETQPEGSPPPRQPHQPPPPPAEEQKEERPSHVLAAAAAATAAAAAVAPTPLVHPSAAPRATPHAGSGGGAGAVCDGHTDSRRSFLPSRATPHSGVGAAVAGGVTPRRRALSAEERAERCRASGKPDGRRCGGSRTSGGCC